MLVRLHALWIALKDKELGATMPEYALMVAFIAIVALVGATALGIAIDNRFDEVTTAVGPTP